MIPRKNQKPSTIRSNQEVTVGESNHLHKEPRQDARYVLERDGHRVGEVGHFNVMAWWIDQIIH